MPRVETGPQVSKTKGGCSGDGTKSLGKAPCTPHGHRAGPLELPSHNLSSKPTHTHAKPNTVTGCSNLLPAGSILPFKMATLLHPITALLSLYPITTPHHCTHHCTPITTPLTVPHHCTQSLLITFSSPKMFCLDLLIFQNPMKISSPL